MRIVSYLISIMVFMEIEFNVQEVVVLLSGGLLVVFGVIKMGGGQYVLQLFSLVLVYGVC